MPSFTVESAASADGPWLTIASGIVGSTYTDDSLIAGQQRFYRVRTVTGQGSSGPSNIDEATTFDAGAPGVPTIGEATAGDDTASVVWTPPADDGGSVVTGYDWELRRTSDDVLIDSGAVGVTTSTGDVPSPNGTAARFRARAVNAVGPGGWSGYSNSVTPQPFEPPLLFSLGWYEADDVPGPPADNDFVPAWAGSGSDAEDFVYGDGWGPTNTPRYRTNIVNGGPVLRFDDADAAFLKREIVSPIPQPFTFAFGLRTLSGGPPSFFSALIVAGSNEVLIQCGSATSMGIAAGTSRSVTTPDLSTGFHTVIICVNGAASFLRIDGAEIPLGGSPGNNPLPSGSAALLIGAPGVAGCWPDISMFGIAPAAPTPTQVLLTEEYMNDKMGLS